MKKTSFGMNRAKEFARFACPTRYLAFVILILHSSLFAFHSYAQGLKDVLGGDCFVGSAINQWQSGGQDAAATAVLRQHFNAAVAENCMKSGPLQPAEAVFDFREADKFVSYCEENGLTPFGHCLVWHSQAPRWFFTREDGRPVSREELISRIQKHIATVVGRYRGRIKGWDVVNEAVEDNGSWRRSPFYNIIGEDFIEIAFRAAHEADPDAELYYNDYSMALPAKRETVCQLVRRLKEHGCRIDAVGMQSHNGLDYPKLNEYENTIKALAKEGVKVMITELDVNVLPNPQGFGGAEVSQNYEYQKRINPYVDGLPKNVEQQFEERYLELFRIYYKHRDVISRINLWGIADHNSWLNGWPVRGRTNYPLLFDRQYNAKPVVNKIIKEWK